MTRRAWPKPPTERKPCTDATGCSSLRVLASSTQNTAAVRTDWALAGTGVTLGLAAMAVDHLLGDDPGLEDPPTFLVSAAVILVIAALLFGLIVPRARDPRRAGFILAIVSVLTLRLFGWACPSQSPPRRSHSGSGAMGALPLQRL